MGLSLVFFVAAGSPPAHAQETAAGLSALETLGKRIFFDTALSLNGNQSCASCHAPEAGFSGPDSAFNAKQGAYEGSQAGRFGKRKPQSAAYATQSPVLHWEKRDGQRVYVGGNFWDGRATGERLGSPAAEQSQAPFVSAHEQALPDVACLVGRICGAAYAAEFLAAAPGACTAGLVEAGQGSACRQGQAPELTAHDRAWAARAVDRMALAIAAYEDSAEVNAYSSKFDAVRAGRARFTEQEARGMQLFAGKAKCANCHPVDSGPGGEPPVFTDHTFDNLGVPRNPDNPWYGQAANRQGRRWIDPGLGATLLARAEWRRDAAANMGKQKVPTLRNVDRRPAPGFVKSYMHNGYFKTLEGVVHFYNTRDAKPRCKSSLTDEARAMAAGCWPSAEVAANVNKEELGRLGLTAAEEAAVVAFMRTLSDGWRE